MGKLSNEKEEFARKIVKEAGLAKPSPDFLSNVMDAVNATEPVALTSRKPLLSGVGWVIFGVFLIGSMVLLYFLPAPQGEWFSKMSFWNNYSIDLPEINFSIPKTFLYGFIMLGLFIAQIPLLKAYMEKRNS